MKLSLVVPLVLVACSTYSKPGASPAELDKAETECEVKMGQARVRRLPALAIHGSLHVRGRVGREVIPHLVILLAYLVFSSHPHDLFPAKSNVLCYNEIR